MRKIYFVFLVIVSACINKNEVAPPDVVSPVPTQVQLDWQEKELFAFIHFTVNTFTDKEWGYGDEDPNVFNPVDFDPEQWVKTLKEAGFKGAILTAKHHDGFCLWPSEFTDHSVKNINWQNGNGDVVGELKKACDRNDLEFGIYLSPWDRNHAEYGRPAYVEYYQNQLNELLDNYGPIFEIWFDGANGGDGYYGGARETRKIDDQVYYKWDETFKIVKEHNANTLIRGDARNSLTESRWCGNEQGYIGETNWNMVNPDTLLAMGKKRIKVLNTGDINGNVWMPAEVDVSIRHGWFYHASEDTLVKTPDQLYDIYLNSVGRGAPLLLNVTPDRRGLIPEQDIASLKGWKEKIDKTFATNLAAGAKIEVDSYRGNSDNFDASKLTDGNKETYWATNDDVKTGTISVTFEKPTRVNYVLIQEYLKLGQRVKSFSVDVFKNGEWQQVAQGTTIGLKRIVKMEPVETEQIRLRINDSRACPVISNVEVY
ncbi:alpha-L-fucosidase [Mariniphaga sediminis]|uniref:alpha-L-fucosidase n=1 Tax=Mariniphaga sediminis TaxID=1628158 RepID=UPI003561B723